MNLPVCKHRGPLGQNGLYPCSSPIVKAPKMGVNAQLCAECPRPDEGPLQVSTSLLASDRTETETSPAMPCKDAHERPQERTEHCKHLGPTLRDKATNRAITRMVVD